MIDKTLAQDIRKQAPSYAKDRDGYFEFLDRVRAARKDMSVTTIRSDFSKLTAKHGRAVTAVVVASTLYERRERLDNWGLSWALEVLSCWPHTEGTMMSAAIQDGIHPTAVCDYAESFIRLNTEP